MIDMHVYYIPDYLIYNLVEIRIPKKFSVSFYILISRMKIQTENFEIRLPHIKVEYS